MDAMREGRGMPRGSGIWQVLSNVDEKMWEWQVVKYPVATNLSVSSLFTALMMKLSGKGAHMPTSVVNMQISS